jgi:hypothetical protein
LQIGFYAGLVRCEDRKTGSFRAKFSKNESLPRNMIRVERPDFHDAISFNFSSRGKEERVLYMQFYNQRLFLFDNRGVGNQAVMVGQSASSPAPYKYLSFCGQFQAARINQRRV